jgi:hypothetical protein
MRQAAETLLLLLAWSAALAVRPWRLLRPWQGQVPLATPLLAALTLLPLLWSWPGPQALPLHWSGAPVLVLVVGWPLAVPVITVAGLGTMLTAGNSMAQAVSLIAWSGLLPATLVLLLGHAVRKASGAHPVGYMLGRAFLVPMLALAACGLAASALGHGLVGPTGTLERVAIALLAMGEASWTCAVVSLLVAYRPQWLATCPQALRPARLQRARPPHPDPRHR